jgi:hypothetical protein
MAHLKSVSVCVLATLICGSAFVASASAAPAFWVEGKLLATGSTEAIAEKTEVVRPFVVSAAGGSAECRVARASSALIEGENKAAARALIFEECSTSQENCKVVSPITTKPLTILLEGTSGALKLNFKPASGNIIETVEFSGSGCKARRLVLEGSMACNYPGVETEATDHLLEFSAGSGSRLEVAGKPAELSGLDKFWLASKKLWAAIA